MSIKDALKLKNFECEIGGSKVIIRRPSAADLIDAVEFSKKNSAQFGAWLVFNHVLEDDGKTQMFTNIEEVLECDAHVVNAIATEVDKLYGEGRD